MKAIIAGITDKGLARANNEDNFALDESIQFLLVCDGAGGQATGEVASRMAVEMIKGQIVVYAREGFKVPPAEKNPKYNDVTNCVVKSITVANESIFEASKKYLQNTGMATTCVAAIIGEKVMSYAHVGDSRLYIIREGVMQQLTSDHSLVNEQLKRGLITEEQAEAAPYKNVLTRALGSESVEVDAAELELYPGDRILLCTDGLTRMLSDDVMLDTLKREPDPQKVCRQMVDLANSLGGRDNITLILANIEKGEAAAHSIFSNIFKGIKK